MNGTVPSEIGQKGMCSHYHAGENKSTNTEACKLRSKLQQQPQLLQNKLNPKIGMPECGAFLFDE